MRGDLNYHHLRYFHAIARAGSIAAACAKLHVAQPTLSGQLRDLERSIGDKLFARVGRRLELTDTGRLVLAYCDEIFALGDDLKDAIEGHGQGLLATVHIGIVDALPKLIAHRLIEPALALDHVRVACREDPPEALFDELAVHNLDVVLSDRPLGQRIHLQAYSHLLGTSGIGFFGTRAFRGLAKGFPASLAGQRVIMPGQDSTLRRQVEAFFSDHAIQPLVAVECEDNGLLLAFGRAGSGIVPANTVLAKELKAMHGLELLAEIPHAVERFYAVTIERRITHPAILAMTTGAKASLR